ncbi:hypothetical protein NLX86_20745 [Streptomyces sp. A3M-1-3]|uniref:hypothetical protein n=1 Tax=Streptomyces sp. A3M-1-3 TaxID=2962044 RepID=UPI0020B7E583|nr:hypothetical protein [Streptomyces sp. A3M-1-3]MCP3820434.1 hypothetical protein [Streptomyces sp. A3M-1-3]
MSEIADTPTPGAAARPISSGSGVATAHESYAFACMRCGYGWEQSYDIEHHVDGKGQEFVTYKANGERVPSPLSKPTCLNCGMHVVRIMRAGQVSSVLGTLEELYHHPVAPGIAGPVPAGAPVKRRPKPAEPVAEPVAAEPAAAERATPGTDEAQVGHHWQLSHLFHPFHRK